MDSQTNLDRVIFLLSTDWFYDKWCILGLALEAKCRTCIQQGARKIVKQIMSGACAEHTYYLTSFSPARLNATRKSYEELLISCGIAGLSLKQLSQLVTHRDFNSQEWFLQTITQRLVYALEEVDEPKLDNLIRKTIITAHEKVEELCNAALLEQTFLESGSSWDTYIRGLTPDLPTRMTDFLNLELSCSQNSAMWTLLRGELTAAQLVEAINWYQSMAQLLFSVELDSSYIDHLKSSG